MRVAVKQNPNEPIPTEVIAQAIVKIAAGMERVNSSGLNQRAIMLLVAHASGVPQTTVRKVLIGLDSLREQYLSKSGRERR